MKFPKDTVPDDAIFAPHHLYIGAFAALLAAMIVWDDSPKREPVGVVAGLMVTLFAFIFIWPFYPLTGALLTLLGLLIATASATVNPFWDSYTYKYRAIVFLCLLVAWDDALEHSFYVVTPLDLFWEHFLSKIVR